MSRSRQRIVLIGLLLATSAGCVGGRLERSYEQGDYLEVVRIFEADSTQQSREGSLYRAGLAYGLPESPAYDPARAIAAFDRLLTLYPRNSRRGHVLDMLQLLREADRTRMEAIRKEAKIAGLNEELEAERARVAEMEKELSTATIRSDALQAIADRLNQEIRTRNERIRALEGELAGLKEIDMNRTPPAALPAQSTTPSGGQP